MWASPLWLESVKDPEIPNFGPELLVNGLVIRAAVCLSVSALFGLLFTLRPKPGRLLAMQGPLVFFQLIVLVPMFDLVDKLRQLPLRQTAELLNSAQKPHEPFVMVGVQKPSLHFYTNQIIVYEGRSSYALVNLADRLRSEERQG